MMGRILGILISIFVLTLSTNFTQADADSLAPPSIQITVNTETDELLATGGTGCSVREAIYSMNNGTDYGGCVRTGSTGRLTVRIPGGEYSLTQYGAGEDEGLTGDLDILTGMDIVGDGIDITSISGNYMYRVFDVLAGDLVTVTISDLSIYNGNSGSEPGGAIRNNSNLYLTTVWLIYNQSDTSGGAIYHKSGLAPASPPAQPGNALDVINAPAVTAVLTLTDSWILHNTAAVYGGGIINDVGSGMVINNTIIRFNKAENAGCGGMYNLSEKPVTLDYVDISSNYATGVGGFGGGLCSANAMTSDITIRDSSFDGNNATMYGGNILHSGNGNLTLIRSEVSYGSAAVGAGIYADANTVLENVTVSHNTATDRGGGLDVSSLGQVYASYVSIVDNIAPSGAGIYSSNNMALVNSIIARNRTVAGVLANCLGAPDHITSQDYNLTDGPVCGMPLMVHDMTYTDPRLGAYGYHGSLNNTNTYALQYHSPAIDAGYPGLCPALDQRGISRPFPVGGFCDIGAFESNFDWWGFLPLIKK
ncbi:MAG: choice-of-anchor Q domain-containing protein [Anaerolineaceae bacterium]